MRNRDVVPIGHVRELLTNYGVEYNTDTEAMDKFQEISGFLEENATIITEEMEVLSEMLYESPTNGLSDKEWEMIHHSAVRFFIHINQKEVH